MFQIATLIPYSERPRNPVRYYHRWRSPNVVDVGTASFLDDLEGYMFIGVFDMLSRSYKDGV